MGNRTREEIRNEIDRLTAVQKEYESAHSGEGKPAEAGWKEIDRRLKDLHLELVKAEISDLKHNQVGPIDTPAEAKREIDELLELRRIYVRAKPPYLKQALYKIDWELGKLYRKLAKLLIEAGD